MDAEAVDLPAGGPGQQAPAVLGIAAVIDRMEELAASMPPGDGVAAFHAMYLETTRQVAVALAERRFLDCAFLDRLDVRFAELYFEALQAHEDGLGPAPRCWSVLFDARADQGTSPLQFAVAGMTAHIAFDLPRALVQTAVELGHDLDEGAVRHDFLAVNDVLAQTQPLVKQSLLVGPWAAMDAGFGEVDDRLRVWTIERVREMAWASAQSLWEVRGSRAARVLEDGLDRLVALSSRAVLSA